MGGRIPKRNRWLVGVAVLIAEKADRGRVEQETLGLLDGQPDPSSAKNTAKVAMREKGDITLERAKARDETIDARGNLSRGFTMRSAVPEKVPARV